MRTALIIHPASQCASGTRVEVEALRPRPRRLDLAFSVTGGARSLYLPPRTWPGRADELWRRTCFEAFVRGARAKSYLEFNFSPSSQWASYRFSDYRTGMRAARELPAPRMEIHETDESFEMRVSLELDRSRLPAAEAWRLGLAAVIEEANGRRSYWALAHPAGKPDFHHSEAFALRLSTGATAKEMFELI
jgi:hypothetical protein